MQSRWLPGVQSRQPILRGPRETAEPWSVGGWEPVGGGAGRTGATEETLRGVRRQRTEKLHVHSENIPSEVMPGRLEARCELMVGHPAGSRTICDAKA